MREYSVDINTARYGENITIGSDFDKNISREEWDLLLEHIADCRRYWCGIKLKKMKYHRR